jgi:hypothetical protein
MDSRFAALVKSVPSNSRKAPYLEVWGGSIGGIEGLSIFVLAISIATLSDSMAQRFNSQMKIRRRSQAVRRSE